MNVTILGNGSGGPYQGRHFTAQVLDVNDQLYLIDCGEGTQMQVYAYRIKIDRIRQVFISHLHGDHVFGLIGILTTFALRRRELPLELFSPPGLKELVQVHIRVCGIHLSYPLVFHEIDVSQSQIVFDDKILEVTNIPLHHRVPATGWLFRQKEKPRKMIAEKIEEYSIPYSLIPGIKAGKDYILADGRTVLNGELTTPSNRPKSYAFCSDTAFFPAISDVVKDVDLLYHEATFTEDAREDAHLTLHSTAAQAAKIAQKSGAGRLLIGHISSRYKDFEQHLLEARAIFPNTSVAEEGKIFEI